MDTLKESVKQDELIKLSNNEVEERLRLHELVIWNSRKEGKILKESFYSSYLIFIKELNKRIGENYSQKTREKMFMDWMSHKPFSFSNYEKKK